jgi:hypothetical protein
VRGTCCCVTSKTGDQLSLGRGVVVGYSALTALPQKGCSRAVVGQPNSMVAMFSHCSPAVFEVGVIRVKVCA